MESQESGIAPAGVYLRTLRGLVTDLRDRESPITHWIVLAICLVFFVQEVVAALLGASIWAITDYFFLRYPVPAWLLSFFLHKGIKHFLANVALIGFLGRVVEPTFTKEQYLSFIAISAVLSGIGAFLFRAPFTSKVVAAYGASGFGYALAAYSFYFPYRNGDGILGALEPGNIVSNTTPAERIAFLFGVSAILSVVTDLLSGPYLTVEWVNGAHLVGVVVGLVVGRLGWGKLKS